MHSETVIESRAAGSGRRRKRGNGTSPDAGPVFVDTSGRRSKVLRRIGLLVGTVCLGYTAILVMAFMGWGTSLTPSSLLPFDGGQSARRPGFEQPDEAHRPTGVPSPPATTGPSATGRSATAPAAPATAG
ncbi:hypothetical protein [Streptomyces sp. LaPpAH-108]|uniref:hypothetical protein n=1 Tax=Streptomyces sp. LaPpAH-108 TaxID=1155714 RepID=UPI000360663D|nr:hypothetical protein [Streptomyces sp. LaPpAH-108]